MADDGYVAWYQAKLWQLFPAVYRAMDGTPTGVPGPLQDLVNRFGAQTATVRRSIDRLWENQSIETCDDWVVPYIGDLLATRLVSCLDARSQRLDVARTIYYRRRSGTLGLLEELAADIAGRDARAVEFFRRLGRTRHQFDPAIGNAFAAAAPWAASTTYLPGQVVSHGANAYRCTAGGTTAASGGPAGTGSAIADGGVTWAFAGPAGALVAAVIEGLAGITSRTPAGGFADLRKPYSAVNAPTAFDEFSHTADLRRGAQSAGWYNISHLGVFIWWRRTFPILGATPVSNGKNPGCFTFDPSGRQMQLFAPTVRGANSFGEDWVAPDEWQLPVAVRQVLYDTYPDQFFPAAFWVGLGGGGAPAPLQRSDVRVQPERGLFSFTAKAPQGQIVTQYNFGLMSEIGAGGHPERLLETIDQPANVATVKGGAGLDTALAAAGTATTVQITDSLTYPGPTAALALPAATLVLRAQDLQRPVVRWAGGGGTWTITGQGHSLVLQGIWLQGADIVLAGKFDSVSLRLVTLDPGTSGTGVPFDLAIDGMKLAPVRLWIEASIGTLSLERCITGPIRTRNAGAVEQITATDSIIQAIATGAADDYALQTRIGTVSLARCTVLGRCAVHRLDASESVLDDVAVAEDTQHGCVRFSAIAKGSALHAPYRSVVVPPTGPVFVSRRFGEPDYARLRRLADAAIIAPQPGDTILGGAESGTEMGAYGNERITLRKRGLALKFEEYAPLGIYPVWIDAD